MTRLSQNDINSYLAQLANELTGVELVEKGHSLSANGYRLWVTLLEDASAGQLRVRKVTMAMAPEPGSSRLRRSREWFSTHPVEDRWSEIDRDEELTPDELLAALKAELVRAR